MLNYFRHLVALHFVVCLVAHCTGHVRFVCPRPQSPRSDVFQQLPNHPLDGQCGLGGSVQFDSEYKEVSPGPFTIRFEETVVHNDSPFSISLHDFDNSEKSCLLLDHIPHNNAAGVRKQCHISRYPIGHCSESTYYITINIPNITCKKCYLQIKSVHVPNSNQDTRCGNNSSCQVYYSCANIRIRPTASGHGKGLESCQKYSFNLLGIWPYRPQKYFKAELKSDKSASPVAGAAVYDEVLNQIHADLPRKVFQTGLMKIGLSTVRNSNTTPPEYDVIYSSPVSPHDYDQSRINIKFRDVPDNVSRMLMDGELYLNIITTTTEYIGVLDMKHEEFEKGIYAPMHTQYSKGGWLSSPEFLGVKAVYPAATYPTGPCSPPSRHYISHLHLRDDLTDTVGALAMTVIDDRLHIFIKLTDHKQPIASIQLISSQLSGLLPLNLPVSKLKNGYLFTVIQASKWIKEIGTLMFLKKVEIRTVDNKLLMDGLIEEGIYSFMGDIDEVHGLGIFQITKGRFLQYTVIMEKTGCEKQSVLLEGPESIIISNITNQLTSKYDDYLLEGYIKELSSDTILNLWLGKISLIMKCEENKTFTEVVSKLTRPGKWYCADIENEHCSVVELTPGGFGEVEGEAFVQPSGLAAFVLDRAKVLQYSIFIGGVIKRGLLEATLTDEDHLILTITLHRSSAHDHVFEARGQLPQSSPDLIKNLLLGRLNLHVTNPGQVTKPLFGALPVITQSECIDSKTLVVGEDKEKWSYDSSPFDTIHALVGDKLVFIYTANTTVHKFKTREDYETCNLQNAVKLEGSTRDNITWTVTYILTPGSNYFGSDNQCDLSPPFKVSVSVIQTDKIVSESRDDCTISLYQVWRQQNLNRYDGPNVVGSAIGGLIAGIIILFLFHLVERRHQNKHERTNSGFQRF
ncbi:hypothetical protein SNE40_009462 [Patella caerulea]|uniref:Uncharacterized protein n=1 Tax=Patella caerulea TaxID=87958 RepID=A0AAN8JTJ4_PATCE